MVPEEFQSEFMAFMSNDMKSAISQNEYDIGLLDRKFGIKFEVQTGNAKPIHQKPYVLHGIRKSQCRNALAQLEKAGIITPGVSAWANPIFLVSKADGRLRLTTDYRRLNAITTPTTYPIRNMQALLTELGGGTYYGSIDVTQGYASIESTEDTRQKTALIADDKVYLTNRMLFGCSTAPAVFSHVMDLVLAQAPSRNGEKVCYNYD